MIPGLISSLAGPLMGLVDDLFTSDEERDAAKLRILKMEQTGELSAMKTQMSAILMEAKSRDPWTSRARPSFMYVIYIFVLSAIPMGFLSAFDPGMALAVADGVTLWLAAIPDAMWTLFGAGYLGYAGARSYDKKIGKAS